MATKDLPTSHVIDMPNDRVSFEADSFDNLIEAHGVTFEHWRSMPCPIGVTDKDSQRSTHHDHDDCSNGFMYRHAGDVTGLFTGNGTTMKLDELGLLDGSTVQVTLPRFYDTNPDKQVMVDIYDRFYLKNFEARSVISQRIEHHQTGIDRTLFPAAEVEILVDANGQEYKQDEDFCLKDGSIVWLPGRRQPGHDPETSRGVIFTVRYTYKAYWYVQRLLHEVRVAQIEDYISGKRKLERMPYAILLQREKSYQNEQRPDDQVAEPRDFPGPRSGSFPPR